MKLWGSLWSWEVRFVLKWRAEVNLFSNGGQLPVFTDSTRYFHEFQIHRLYGSLFSRIHGVYGSLAPCFHEFIFYKIVLK